VVHWYCITSLNYFRGQEWGAAPDASCFGETEPIHKEGYRSDGSDYGMMHTVERVIENMKPKGVNVQILNITQLSEYRKDAHPSIYRRQYVNLTEAQLANPKSYSDCNHWCLPGVPDVWNEFLYAYIVSS
jgi:GDSL/SGNH-like Acyl-Esterase family found in Pmr5 and Cas1p